MNMDALYNDRSLAADAAPDVRATFIRRTYGHLAGAIFAFIAIEVVAISDGLSGSDDRFARP